MADANTPQKSITDYVKSQESGLIDFDRVQFKAEVAEQLESDNLQLDSNFLYFLGLFSLNNFQEIEKLLYEDPSLIASLEIKAIKILTLVATDKEIKSSDFYPNFVVSAQSKDKFALRLCSVIADILELIFAYVNDHKIKIKQLFALAKICKEFNFFIAKLILDFHQEDFYFKFESLCNDLGQLDSQKNYLLSYFYNLKGEHQKAQEYKFAYFDTQEEIDEYKKIKIKKLGSKYICLPEQIKTNWQKFLQEFNRLNDEVLTKTGIEPSSCADFKCADCCTYTSPTMSFTEYEYLKDWIKENNFSMQPFRAKFEQIQAEYEQKFAERMQIVNKDEKKSSDSPDFPENPHHDKYRCPFLDEKGLCSVYEARPLTCRAFGTATNNAVNLNSCNYYVEQYQRGSSFENERYCADLASFNAIAACSDRKNSSDNMHKKATIVAWFTEDYFRDK